MAYIFRTGDKYYTVEQRQHTPTGAGVVATGGDGNKYGDYLTETNLQNIRGLMGDRGADFDSMLL